jgi:uncharacterized protein YicC (UPF0701 family)
MTTIKTKIKENWKEDKANLQNAVLTLKKSMTDFKDERKSEWKSFKNKFNDDMENVEKSLKKLNILHKK